MRQDASAATEALPKEDKESGKRIADASRIVDKPISNLEAEDPHTFQILQIKTRFSAREEPSASAKDEVMLHFKMTPSDPDFPFDIHDLECTLHLPANFLRDQSLKLRVTNIEMERGFQLNVERGFDAIWMQTLQPTLLSAMKTLDKQLEELLTARKVETVKIIANTGVAAPSFNAMPSKALQHEEKSSVLPKASAAPIVTPAPTSMQRREQARSKRETETQILHHRLGRHPQFSTAAEGTIYTLPTDPRKRNDLPASLANVKMIRLFVPLLYDIEPCTIELLAVQREAASNVEKAFARWAEEHRNVTLLGQVNWLVQNIHTLAVTGPEPPIAETRKLTETERPQLDEPFAARSIVEEPVDTANRYVKIIPRPPEWTTTIAEDDGYMGSSDESYYSDSEEEEFENIDNDQIQDNHRAVSSVAREKGILISFPSLELYGIELLELTTISITVKCERCKDTMDFNRIKDNERGDYTGIRSETCKKCAFTLGLGQ